MQKFLHKSSQTQQMLKKSSNSKSLAKIDVFLSPNFNYTIKNDKLWDLKKCGKFDYISLILNFTPGLF